MIYFMDEYSGFRTISFVKMFIEVRQIVDEYIAKDKMQIDDQVKVLKVEIEDEFMKDIHELISLSLEVEFIWFVFSSISPSSRGGVAERYCTRLMSMVNLMYLETSFPHSLWDYAVVTASYTKLKRTKDSF